MDFNLSLFVISLAIMYIGGHCLGDYAFQSEFMALGKNKFLNNNNKNWYIILGAHASIHAFIVFLITFFGSIIFFLMDTGDASNSVVLVSYKILYFIIKASLVNAVVSSLFEFVTHFIIDYNKCKGEYSFAKDQILHISVKFVMILPLIILGLT